MHIVGIFLIITLVFIAVVLLLAIVGGSTYRRERHTPDEPQLTEKELRLAKEKAIKEFKETVSGVHRTGNEDQPEEGVTKVKKKKKDSSNKNKNT